jgi:hypothetical protein
MPDVFDQLPPDPAEVAFERVLPELSELFALPVGFLRGCLFNHKLETIHRIRRDKEGRLDLAISDAKWFIWRIDSWSDALARSSENIGPIQ